MSNIHLEITFRSGATITVPTTEEWSWKRTPYGMTLKWETPEGSNRRLVSILNLEEIVAIVEVRK